MMTNDELIIRMLNSDMYWQGAGERIRLRFEFADRDGKPLDLGTAANEDHSEPIDEFAGLKEQIETISETVTAIGDTLAGSIEKSVTTDDLRAELNVIRQENAELKATIDNINTTVDNLKTTVDNINTRGEEMFGWLKSLFSGESEKQKGEIARLKKYLENKQREIDRLNGEVNDKQQAIDRLNGEVSGKQREIDRLNGEVNDKQQAINQLNGAVSGKQNEIDRLQTELGDWNRLTRVYSPILSALKNCEMFSSILQTHKIEGSEPEQLFALATAIGKTIDFAKEIQTCALKAKLANAEPMTAREIAVYSALNTCYREVWEVDFDAFTLPGKRPIEEEFKRTNFDKNEVLNMKNPNDKQSKYTQAVYVPMLFARNGNLYAKAQVKAGNM